jgi:TRAP-type C4-dicarboxylate transport system permease small subunit
MSEQPASTLAGPERPAPAEAPRRTKLANVLVRADKIVEGCAIGMLVAMIFIVFLQVVTRKVFRFVFFWSEELTLLCLTWFSFMGIAIGFREKLHLAMDMVSSLLPKKVDALLDRLVDLSNFGFGLYLVVYGFRFTQLMSESTLPATGLPNSVQYWVIPITGVLTCAYAALHLLGVDTRRFHHIEEEIVRDDA